MSTGLDSIPPLAEAAVWPAGRMSRVLKDLRNQGLLPTGGSGGGRAAAHYSAAHYARILLGCGGTGATNAADAYAVYAPLRLVEQNRVVERAEGVLACETTATRTATVFRGMETETADAWLARLISALEDPDLAAELERQVGGTWQMTLCKDPASISVSWRDPDGAICGDIFELPQRALSDDFRQRGIVPQRIRRLTVLPFKMLETCGRLSADTTRRINTASAPKLKLSKSDQGSKTKSAALPGAAPIFDQPRRSRDATKPSERLEYVLEPITGQAHTGRRGCQSTFVGVTSRAPTSLLAALE